MPEGYTSWEYLNKLCYDGLEERYHPATDVQMDSGKLNGHEFAVSNQLPNGSGSNRPTNVVLGNFSEFMIGRQGSMESEMFREGTVTDEDGNTISAVDQDCTILRIIDLHDFGIRHEESFVIGKNMQTKK